MESFLVSFIVVVLVVGVCLVFLSVVFCFDFVSVLVEVGLLLELLTFVSLFVLTGVGVVEFSGKESWLVGEFLSPKSDSQGGLCGI